jgi:ABC-type transport system substrate-binding protein
MNSDLDRLQPYPFERLNALKAGEAQIVMTQPQLAFEELASDATFTVSSSPGPVFEHWGLNLNNKHLISTDRTLLIRSGRSLN